jgi:hypothetical protein
MDWIHKGSLLIIISVFSVSAFALKPEWRIGFNYFFDNTEFAKSTYTKDQTMSGTHISPELGYSIDSTQSVFGGIDLLKISGSQHVVDIFQPIAYYRYKTPKMCFYAGAFPRHELLSNYSSLFFQDSVVNFRPNLNGVFWKLGSKNAFLTLWMDWTGYQTLTQRESFFVGSSGAYNFGGFFVDFQSYMFHLANTLTTQYQVSDNILGHLSLGFNHSNKMGLDTLLVGIGVLGGVENDRSLHLEQARTPIGAVFRFNFEYKGIGTENYLYLGDQRNVYYHKFSTNLYWNNPFLQGSFYANNQLYVNIVKSDDVKIRLVSRQHFSEGKVMTEQYFTTLLNLESIHDNLRRQRKFFYKRLLER